MKRQRWGVELLDKVKSMKVFDQPRPCSSCGEFDIEAMLGATTVLKDGVPLFPSRALIYCRRCMYTHGKSLVILKPLMDVTWEDLKNFIRDGYLNLGVLDVTLGKKTQEVLVNELDRNILIEAATKTGKTKEEAMALFANEFSYHDLYEVFGSNTNKIIRIAITKSCSS